MVFEPEICIMDHYVLDKIAKLVHSQMLPCGDPQGQLEMTKQAVAGQFLFSKLSPCSAWPNCYLPLTNSWQTSLWKRKEKKNLCKHFFLVSGGYRGCSRAEGTSNKQSSQAACHLVQMASCLRHDHKCQSLDSEWIFQKTPITVLRLCQSNKEATTQQLV